MMIYEYDINMNTCEGIHFMTEYKISIKLRQKLPPEDRDAFLDDWIVKIEELGLQFGGGLDIFNPSGMMKGVIDFRENRKDTIEKKMFSLQSWLTRQPSKPVIMRLRLLLNDIDYDIDE